MQVEFHRLQTPTKPEDQISLQQELQVPGAAELAQDSCSTHGFMLRALYIHVSHLGSPGVQETRKPQHFEYT